MVSHIVNILYVIATGIPGRLIPDRALLTSHVLDIIHGMTYLYDLLMEVTYVLYCNLQSPAMFYLHP